MRSLFSILAFFVLVDAAFAQQATYEITIPAVPPYYRVQYEASDKVGELAYPVSYTLWVPPGVGTLRGLIVHQHGCGEGSCRSGQTGAFDLHWQALASKHECALMSPVYEQPDKANCQLWCDPRNGSDAAFQRSLADLGKLCSHPELESVPWALWGHSGGGHWAGGMAFLHPERVAAAWLRSGVPSLKEIDGKPVPYDIPSAACHVPIMCNLGTKEGVTVKDGRFAGVWPGVEAFFYEMRSRGALIGVSVDPLTAHECGNQRYLAIPWLDACLASRLPARLNEPLKSISLTSSYLAPLHAGEPEVVTPVPAEHFRGDLGKSVWLPNESIALAWTQYEKDSAVTDKTPPPTPVKLAAHGNKLTWEAMADVESGLAHFIIERDGKYLATVPEQARNPYGRPIFQNLQYSDTPTQPLAKMEFTDTTAEPNTTHRYRVIAVNTVGLKSNEHNATVLHN